MITIVVGEEKEEEQRFTVHKDMIYTKSKFFRAACSELWASGRERIVRPPEGALEQYQIYVEWVYTSRINIDARGSEHKQEMLVEMFILGDVIDDYQLRNTTMEALIASIQEPADDCIDDPLSSVTTTCYQLHRVYEATMAGSPLRQFFVNWIMKRSTRDSIKSLIAVMPAEFVQELAVAALEQIELMDDEEFAKFVGARFQPERGGA